MTQCVSVCLALLSWLPDWTRVFTVTVRVYAQQFLLAVAAPLASLEVSLAFATAVVSKHPAVGQRRSHASVPFSDKEKGWKKSRVEQASGSGFG